MAADQQHHTVNFDGGVYVGTLNEDGHMHGKGRIEFTSGDTYEGGFRNDLMHGYGTYRWIDGDVYIGNYVDDQQQGEGGLTDATGEYTGEWLADKRHGFGRQTFRRSEEEYIGEWYDDKRHGYGKVTQKDNQSYYEGGWIENNYHGRGMSKNPDGDVYEGEFVGGRPHGMGSYSWSSGITYHGAFVDGKKHGEGREKLPGGAWLSGRWIMGNADRNVTAVRVEQPEMDVWIREFQSVYGFIRKVLSNPLKHVHVEVGESVIPTVGRAAAQQTSAAGGSAASGGGAMGAVGSGSSFYEAADRASPVTLPPVIDTATAAESFKARSGSNSQQNTVIHGGAAAAGGARRGGGGGGAGGGVAAAAPISVVGQLQNQQNQQQPPISVVAQLAAAARSTPPNEASSSAVSTQPAVNNNNNHNQANSNHSSDATAAGGGAVAQQQQQQQNQPQPASPNAQSSSGANYSYAQMAYAAPTVVDSELEGATMARLLGKGSFGSVFEAFLPAGKQVCVKQIELGNIRSDAELQTLENEINLMKRLHHPNIVEYYGCRRDEEKKTMNIYMELVTGGSVQGFVKRLKTMPLPTVRSWTRQVLHGVWYLHNEGIIHRDIKGDNLLVSGDGIVKLADFGCSKQIDDVCSKTRGCNTMVGTPYWMAPEVIRCEADTGYGAKSDIWSVGCTVVEMITGRPPWPESDSMWAAVFKIANSTGLPPGIPENLPTEVMDFLTRCFERDPRQRATAEELLEMPWMRPQQ